jgi:hypothetical protein
LAGVLLTAGGHIAQLRAAPEIPYRVAVLQGLDKVSAVFLEVREVPPAADATAPPREVFTGWMFASSPALSALEHPVYDIWVVGCDEAIGSDADQGESDATGPASE